MRLSYFKIIIKKSTCYPTVNTPRLKTSQKTMTRKIIVVHINNMKHTNIREMRLLLMLMLMQVAKYSNHCVSNVYRG